LLAAESDPLHELNIHKIHVPIAAHVSEAEKVSTTKHRKLQEHLNRARHVATTWPHADYHKAIFGLEREIHQLIPVNQKLFEELFQHYKQHQ
jgi:hypothetical protein